MSFNSISFLIFLPIVLILYWLIPHKFRWFILLLASYFFYLSWNIWLGFLILGTTIVSYVAGIGIEKIDNKAGKRTILILTLIICLSCLFVFKYLDFFLGNIISLLNAFSLNIDPIVLNLILPIGISFYTFQTLSYVIDVYRKEINAEYHFGYYALYVSFFPQLVAGPIERAKDLLPQLKEQHNISNSLFIAGGTQMMIGFFKKLVIADFFAHFVEVVYSSPLESSSPAIIIATILFAFQIYCDFSGYSDIAIGVAKMMGINLTENFDSPYLATSVKGFWKRWHISLSNWFTSYIYIPLGGNRKGPVRHILNILIVFFLSGIWHGANWTFIIWGLLNGGMYAIQVILEKPFNNLIKKYKINSSSLLFKIPLIILTFTLISFTWIFFRAQSLADAAALITNLFTKFSISNNTLMNYMNLKIIDIIQIILSLGLLSLLPYLKNKIINTQEKDIPHMKYATIMFYLIFIITLSWIFIITNNGESSFIYFQF